MKKYRQVFHVFAIGSNFDLLTISLEDHMKIVSNEVKIKDASAKIVKTKQRLDLQHVQLCCSGGD